MQSLFAFLFISGESFLKHKWAYIIYFGVAYGFAISSWVFVMVTFDFIEEPKDKEEKKIDEKEDDIGMGTPMLEQE